MGYLRCAKANSMDNERRALHALANWAAENTTDDELAGLASDLGFADVAAVRDWVRIEYLKVSSRASMEHLPDDMLAGFDTAIEMLGPYWGHGMYPLEALENSPPEVQALVREHLSDEFGL